MTHRARSPEILILLCFCAVVLTGLHAVAAELEIRGQVSGWNIQTTAEDQWRHDAGLRYVPQATFAQAMEEGLLFDMELSVSAHASATLGDRERDADVEIYRFKARFATPQTETRLGLQQINFGPARLLRSLRWFDRLDPRDALQLTEGVHALSFRYTALNNASLWLWGLHGNEDPKGYETLPTVSGRPEGGGRFQYPVPRGEVAVTFHGRIVDGSLLRAPYFTENRMALDGRWDAEIGLWFEWAVQEQRGITLPFPWSRMFTLGADYTFAVGNGLHVLAEHMCAAAGDSPVDRDQASEFSAWSANYPLGLLDTLSAIGYYLWEDRQYYQYLNWQRTYDNLSWNLGFFHYPDEGAGLAGAYQHGIGRGYGWQWIIVYNH